ncbi:ABC transporter substrate-binding protein [Streptococcus thoraltensis]|uniref:ABC transporter substrate-binding protein n=1 Tax=Streptococcus thoraltensis TaxID=55085 RepID=UPI001F585580|nr:ABC transporter substrate-binding protein [Streptococcus thoraltensis]
MKKSWKTVVTLGATALLLAACSQSGDKTSSKETPKVGILQYVEHESLTAARKGFEKGLAEEGYKDGKNIKISYENAQGDQANLQSISEKLVSDNDLVLGIATPAAQSLVTASSGTPILFTAVTDPVSAKLVKSMKNPSGVSTGTSDMSPVEEQVKLVKKVLTDAKKVGIMYTTSERNSEVQVAEAEKLFKKANIKVVKKGISSTNDVQDTAKSLMKDVDVVFVPTDNTIASAITLLSDLSKETKVPVVGGSADMVEGGVLFSYGPDYEKLGEQTAKLAVKVIEGKDVSKISAEYPDALNVSVNDDMAKALDIDVSSIKKEK